ncbi:DinB family protein [Fodinibius sp.]|uniref:DinB family protein n=1 Tax=Fodinibius sp. TaxID=1872440 RepID=UPI002ACE1AB5|nr:DinB family protein [Fodinibius sp.]MDZ7659368.1 DinB family protein [Fodinibius sp.]
MKEMQLSMWKMGRKRLTNQLDDIQDADLLKRIDSESNSVGWLLRHMAEVELLFSKNVFGRELDVKAQTIGSLAKDRGQFTDLASLMELIERAGNELKAAIEQVDDWDEEVTTAEFGTVTKAEALARIMTHTAYHAGQVALSRKYGKEY